MSNRQEKPPLKCLLGIDPEKAQKCKPSECASCGWEAAEAARRREYVKEHGLTLCADGFRRLIIKPVVKTFFGDTVLSAIQPDPAKLIFFQKVINCRTADPQYFL